MSWSEVSPGHYTRPLGENECMIKTIGDRALPLNREHWSLSFSAQFKAKPETIHTKDIDLATKLRKAWQVLRFRHPSIACIATDGLVHYVVPDTQSLDAWTGGTFVVVDEGHITASDLVAGFKPGPHVIMYYLPRNSQVLIHASHWRTDGVGAIQLLDAYFEAVISEQDPLSLPWGLEVTRLAPSVEEALQLPTTASDEIKAEAHKCLGTIALTRGAVGAKYRGDSSTPPGGTRSARLQLSQSSTKAIQEACKARNTDLIAAVHAAVAAINYTAAPAESQHKPYTSTIRTSLRPYLPAPYNTPVYACGLYTSGLMVQIPASHTWAQNAAIYHAHYTQPPTPGFIRARREYARQMLAVFSKPAPPPKSPPTPSDIDISSIGDAELLIKTSYGTDTGKEIEVLGISLGVETVTRQMYAFVWVFGGRLEFNLVYNEGYYEGAFVEGLLERLRGVLGGGVGC